MLNPIKEYSLIYYFFFNFTKPAKDFSKLAQKGMKGIILKRELQQKNARDWVKSAKKVANRIKKQLRIFKEATITFACSDCDF